MKSLINEYFVKQPRLRRFVTRLLERDQDVTVSLVGASVRINTIKEHGYLRASRFSQRNSLLRDELPVIANLSYVCHQADAFVDIGANVGVFSAIMARFQSMRPLAIHAFEPNPDTYRRLVETTKGLDVRTHNCALSDRDGTLKFVSGTVSHIFTTVEHASEYTVHSAPIEIPCQRLDSIPIAGDRLVLKIDVEGQELAVLKGATKLFEARRIAACYIDGFEGAGVPAFLRQYGFTLFDGRSMQRCDAGDCYALLGIAPPKAA